MKEKSAEEVAARIVNNFADLMLPTEERYVELEFMIIRALRIRG